MFDDISDKDDKELDLKKSNIREIFGLNKIKDANTDKLDDDDDFDFEDNDIDIDDNIFSFDDDDDKLLSDSKDENNESSNKAFVMIAGTMIFLFIAALIAILLIATHPIEQPPTKETIPSYDKSSYLVFPSGTKDWKVTDSRWYCLIENKWRECYPIKKDK